jgi:type I restriction enzyme, S subunit
MKNGWKTKTLGDVADISAGNSAPQAESLFKDGTYPFFRTADTGRVRFGDIYKSTDYLNEEGIRGLRRFPKGTILFPKSGASTFLNHRVMLGVEGCVSSHLATIVADEAQIKPRFLLYFLSTVASQDLIQDHAYPSLNLPTIAGIGIQTPPLSEQQRIVGILDEAFEGIATTKANTEKNLANARALFESHLHSVFTKRGKGWVEKSLSELCGIKHGFAFKSEFFTSEGDYVLLTPGNFYESGGYRDRGEKQKYYIGEIPRDYVLSEGDLLVAMTEQAAGLLGSPILVPESEKFLHNQRLGLVTKKPGVPWINEFFFHVFNTQPVRKEIHDSASGVKVRHTSPTKIGEVIVSFPTSLSEQRAIVSTLKDLREETQRLESIYQQKLVALEALKKSLLNQAFTGQLSADESTQSVSVAIPFPQMLPNINTTDLHAGILAMAYDFHEKAGELRYFGHVKAEKIAHMVEARLGIYLGRKPVKDAAGPNDFTHLIKVEHRARKTNFFDFKQVRGGPYQVLKLRGFNRLLDETRTALGQRLADVEGLLQWMLPMTVQQAEIVATVYAAWNNLLLDGRKPTDEEIVREAREDWHPDKLKIEREKFFKAIGWLRKEGVVPEGKGPPVIAKGKRVVKKSA